MQRFTSVVVALSLMVGMVPGAPGQSQSREPAEFIQVITITVSPDAVVEYEDFVRKIKAGADKVGAPQRWSTSQVSQGGPGFTYSIVLPFSKWGEIDRWMAVREVLSKAFGPAEGARILKAGLAAIKHNETAVYRLLPGLSTRPEVFSPPPPFVHLFVTEVDPAMGSAWEGFLARLKAAQEKAAQVPTHLQRVSVLGDVNTYVTAVPFASYAERDSWPTTMEVLRQAYGEAEARSLDETRRRSTRHARQLVLMYRPDLSRPAGASAASR
jgi:hypothetical protein